MGKHDIKSDEIEVNTLKTHADEFLTNKPLKQDGTFTYGNFHLVPKWFTEISYIKKKSNGAALLFDEYDEGALKDDGYGGYYIDFVLTGKNIPISPIRIDRDGQPPEFIAAQPDNGKLIGFLDNSTQTIRVYYTADLD